MNDRIAVVGLWHLGCSLVASWTRLGRQVEAIDFDEALVADLKLGRPPIFEPGLAEAWSEALERATLRVGTDAAAVKGCRFVFIAYDTPVGDDDSSDVSPIEQAIERCGPHMDDGAIVIISAQLPMGTSRVLRDRLRAMNPTLDLAYSPENLRLGEAIKCYLEPGHIVVGAEAPETGRAVESLFAPMKARVFTMNLASSEMVKHCINSFLATSVTMANQWSDIASAMGADFGAMVPALRADPRIGERAYITPGIGFSGGTLGRDLRVLHEINAAKLGGAAPLFGQVWSFNSHRFQTVARRVEELLASSAGKRVALLGMTYKPGTSTLRRSLPLSIATELASRKIDVRVHDPKADWSSVSTPAGLAVADSAYAAAEQAELVVVLTEWPEYRQLDFTRLAKVMRQPRILDPKGFLRAESSLLAQAGLQCLPLVGSLNGSHKQ